MPSYAKVKTTVGALIVVTVCLLLLEMMHVHYVSLDVHGIGDVISCKTLDRLAYSWHSSTQRNKTKMDRIERFLAERAVHVEGVNCKGVVEGDTKSLVQANITERTQRATPEYDEYILRDARTCSSFLQRYGFLTDSLTDTEKAFPLAYSILAYRDAAQVVFMLRTIYRPQNSYCIHVDKKSRGPFQDAMRAVSRCLPGVFIASRLIDVGWGGFSVLEPEIVCMQDLWKHSKTWRYFINLTGQEFPLKTNYELVKILRTYNGANDIHGFIPNGAFQRRWKHLLPASHNVTVYAGAVQVTVSRAFVDFLLHDRVAQDFLNWTSRTRQPDENYFGTLNYNAQLSPPGGYRGNLAMTPPLSQIKPYLIRLKNWVQTSGHPCPGHMVRRQLCIFSVLDVPWLSSQPHLFANKFYYDYSRLALGCLAEDLFNRTRDQTLGRRDFDVSYYENLPYIKDKMTF